MLLPSSDKDAVPVADRIRVPRNPLEGAKGLLLESTRVTVSGGALTMVWPSEGRQLLAHGSGIIVAWGCEPPAPMLGASVCPASSPSSGGRSHTAAVFSSDCVASSAVNAAARFTCWATLFAFSLSLSAFHVSRPQALLARYPTGLEHRRSPPVPTRLCLS